MNWIELISFASLLFLFLLSFLICRKLGIQFSKVTVSFPVIITITFLNTLLFRFIERKYDDHSQLETEKKINQKPLPVQNKGEDYLPNENHEVEEVCCGGLPEEERQAFKQRLESAWKAGSDSDPEFIQLLPAHEALVKAETTFKQSAGPLVTDGESEIDLRCARFLGQFMRK
jgi:hypothetical protein